MNISNRLVLPLESVERIVAGLSALGYMSDTGRLEPGGPRHLMRANLPARSEVTPEPDTPD